ncbi:MAG: hypothetical protein RBR22_10085 [Desulfuromonas sp.]|nr:hypothetical protein [Desulfuromonas sp.]
MKKHATTTAILILTLAILLPTIVAANDRPDRPQGPPPEAISACEGKSVGDSVEFTGRRGETVKATCKKIDDKLAAVPDNMPERQ